MLLLLLLSFTTGIVETDSRSSTEVTIGIRIGIDAIVAIVVVLTAAVIAKRS